MKLHIEMFGEFTIYVDGEKNFQYEGRTRKLWNLLQYLLVNRNRPVPQACLLYTSSQPQNRCHRFGHLLADL